MGLLDIFRKKSNEIPTTPVPTISNNQNQINYINIKRDDGSTISIAPQTDNMGSQLYSQVYNPSTNESKLLPRFWIISDELRALSPHSNLIHESILIDINPNMLEHPYYANQIANVLLNANRMQKIMRQYHKYAGGLEYDQDGYVTGKYVDQGIINSLGMDEQQREAERRESIKRDLAQKEAAAATHSMSIEENPEGVLSQDMLNDYR